MNQANVAVKFDHQLAITNGTTLSITIETTGTEKHRTSVCLEGPLTVNADTGFNLAFGVARASGQGKRECAYCASYLEYIGKADSGDDANRVYRCVRCNKQVVSARRLPHT